MFMSFLESKIVTFDPEEADEIAEELKAAANQARNMGGKNKKGLFIFSDQML